jgi:hypothetical protein
MKKRVTYFFLLLTLYSGSSLFAQDTLPKFTLKNVGKNRIVVSWTNPFPTIAQLSIQRSYDSVKGYKTIMTMADPTTPQNGYVDTKAPDGRQFYRLYIMLEGGRYMFCTAKRPMNDTSYLQRIKVDTNVLRNVSRDSLLRLRAGLTNINRPDLGKANVLDSLFILDSLLRIAPLPAVIKLGNFQTGDSASIPNAVVIKNRPTAFVPSLYVYTNKDGYVKVSLPEEGNKKYMIRFFDEDDSLLFELKDMKAKSFRIDKANFFHAGWFRFEIYEDGKLLEKHKFYLEKDF